MKTVAMLLAGGAGTRLSVLTETRAKPAVPFAGKFRIIDFTLSNCVNSGIYTVGVLTQYRPHSLNEHIGIGKPWDLDRGRGGVRLLPPFQGREGHHWYGGTADAIYQNLDFLESHHADNVLVLSGDHIYKMDYSAMIAYHEERGADLTIAVMTVPLDETDRFGIMEVDAESRIVRFHEKPKNRDKGQLASLGIYVFNRRSLEKRISEGTDASPRTDFGMHVIPAMLEAGDNVVAWRYDGYWVDVGTIDALWSTNLELVGAHPQLDLYNDRWPILTQSEERPPVKFGPQAKVLSSLVSNGCVVRGLVSNSVLSPGVYVSPGAVVTNSVIANDTWIGPGARVDKVVSDKHVMMGAGATVGDGEGTQPNTLHPSILFNGITLIGRNAFIPEGAVVGRNVLISSGADERAFPADRAVGDGETIQGAY